MNALTNNIQQIIKDYEKERRIAFTPSRKFYESLGIGQKRFWQIAKNEVQPTLLELKSIADYFKVNPKDLF